MRDAWRCLCFHCMLGSELLSFFSRERSGACALMPYPEHLRLCPHVPKWSFFPPSSPASIQEYVCPKRTNENGSTRCSSYSRSIGDAWNSPKTEKKRRSMHIMLARCIQTDSRRRNRTQQEDKNGQSVVHNPFFFLMLWMSKVHGAQTRRRVNISQTNLKYYCSLFVECVNRRCFAKLFAITMRI